MDFFSAHTDATVTPAMTGYFTIYDPTLSVGEDDSEQQLLVFLPEDKMDINTKVRCVGMAEGIHHFTEDYTKGEQLDFVELDDGYLIYQGLESKFKAVLRVQLTKVEDQGAVEFKTSETAPVHYFKELVIRGYDQFRLHNGTIQSLYDSMSRDECARFLTKWWSVWFMQIQLDISEDGALKMAGGFRRSQLRCDSEAYTAAVELQKRHGFKDLLIWSPDFAKPESYGLVYEHSKLLVPSCKLRFLQWLEETNFYGLTSESLCSPNVIKSKQVVENTESEQVYDPFKMVFNTLSDISTATGITYGVNTSFKAVSDGVGLVNQYLPVWGASKEPTKVDDSPIDEYFLVGAHEGAISFKNVYLQFDDEEKLHRVLIFKAKDLLIVLIYEFSVNTLNEMNYYQNLFEVLRKFTRDNKPTRVETTKNFYFMAMDKARNCLESNIPMIPTPDVDEDSNDSRYFYDLSLSRVQSLLCHREMISSMEPNPWDHQVEKLSRTKNGWWCYHLRDEAHSVVVLKKWRVFKGERGSLLENSADIRATIGADAKQFVDKFMAS